MPLFAYNRDIPDGPNNPSADQPLMKTNTNSTDDLINFDHYSFDLANGGLHRQTTFPVQTIPSTSAGQAAIYSNTAGQTQLFATTDAGANAYQLTRFIDANFATFGTFTASGTVTAGYTQFAGWSFMPGGMLYQYGRVTRAAGISPSTIVVGFPVTFTSSNLVVLVAPICAIGGTSQVHVASVQQNTVATTGFTCNFDSSTSSYVGFTWTAVGR